MVKTFTINITATYDSQAGTISGTSDMTSTEIIELLDEFEKEAIPRIKWSVITLVENQEIMTNYYSIIDYPGRCQMDEDTELDFMIWEKASDKSVTIDSEGNLIDISGGR